MPGKDYTPAIYNSPNAVDDRHLGPAMRALNPRQRAVVWYLLDTGSRVDARVWSAAAEAAGYSAGTKNRSVLWVTAHRLRHNPAISEAIIEEGKRRVAHDLPAFLNTIAAIGSDTAHKDALKAALAGAAMSGVSPISVSKQERHVVHHGDLMEQAAAAARILGVNLDDLIRGRMIDVTPDPLDISDLK